ncbi:MAG TPA: VOC family protein [Opitutaceae bacterium]|nr:VOC family protein [Opitutaceae bacterium]
MKILGTDFVMYHVSDLARAVEFYRDILGLPLTARSEEHHWAEFDCGNVTLALQAGPHPARAGCGARIALAVDNIDAAYERLVAMHASVVQPPQDHGVCHAFDVRDPDGNLILLHCRADGTVGQVSLGEMPVADQHALSARR